MERRRSCEKVTLLKKHVVKNSSSENVAAIKSSRSKKATLQKK